MYSVLCIQVWYVPVYVSHLKAPRPDRIVPTPFRKANLHDPPERLVLLQEPQRGIGVDRVLRVPAEKGFAPGLKRDPAGVDVEGHVATLDLRGYTDLDDDLDSLVLPGSAHAVRGGEEGAEILLPGRGVA